ncbi:MAG: DUF373 family protein, partial [Candidatus Diapherotrites archaeon]|nr:DUF373 family protein [Candidatus Diapherotrites archaeon]
EKNLEAANKLLLADPTESDANCIFAAVKMYDELKDKIDGLEVITITGFGKAGFKSDQRLNEQLDMLEKKYSINGFILVTDGAEDDQIVPILQSRARIISKEIVVIKQAQQVESIYYTIKEALEDPYIARIVFAIPGTIVLFYALTLFLNIQSLFIQGVSFIVGLYLVMKGLGIELKLSRVYKSTLDALSPQKASFPFYVGSVFIFIFGIYAFLQNIFFGSAELTMEHYISALQSTYLFFALVFISVCFAKALDHVQMKKAYLLRKDFLYAVSVITIWIIIDSATLVFLREADLNFFLFSMLVSFVIILIAFKVSDSIDLTKKATELLLGLPVYDIAGRWLGRIVEVDKRRNAIVFAKSDNEQQRSQKFRLVDGKVLVI